MARQTFYFSDGPYLQAMQGLHGALSGSEAFVKFIGQPRTGKSGVCEKLTQYMRLKDYRVIYFDYPIESPDMLRSRLAKELDIPDTFNMLRHLEDALAVESNKPLVIIFDDAHQLSDISLIEIYRLAGVQVEQRRVINIVLCGEPELERRLSSKQEFKSLLQQVSHNFLLEPMNSTTAAHFLSAYLEKMELPGLVLDAAALNQFYKSCKGFPGPAYSLCQLVLTLRQGSIEQSPITKQELLRGIRSSNSEQPVSSSLLREGSRWIVFAPIAAVVVIASLALLVRQLNPPEGPSSNTAAPSPFAVDELLVADTDSPTLIDSQSQAENEDESAPLAVAALELQVAESEEVQLVSEEELPVSDSNLALVTAQERGISNETIAEPLFEQMASSVSVVRSNDEPVLSVIDESAGNSSEPVALASITLTRPMLALDDDDIEIDLDIPVAEPLLNLQENAAEVVPDTALETPESIEPLPNEPIAPELPSMSPQQVVQSWLDAWEGQDLENYFASYADDFIPRYHRSKSAWQSNRERVIGNASQISLELSDFVIISEDAETIEVHFWLAYSSPSYRDDTRKKLILRKLPASEQGVARLVILEEINLEVRV